MSTKSTYLYGKTFHYYYDYADCDFHLVIKKGNKELKLPKEFIMELNDLCMLRDNVMAIRRLTDKLKDKEE